MKYSERWLKEWVQFEIPTTTLATRLTAVGLEIESVGRLSKSFTHVVLGKIISVEKHPKAEKLQICQVDIGEINPLQIVCGASNVRSQQLVAVAKIGAQLPGDIHISEVIMREVKSQGMLCSATELGLPLESNQDKMILDLATQEKLGTPIETVLGLDDAIIDIGLTPNRGDCLSIRGLAREIAALNQSSILEKNIPDLPNLFNNENQFTIQLLASDACPLYSACVIRHIPKNIQTPTWMKERLQRLGVRCIHFLVDVTNYVMLEYGQPMHAFDLSKWQGEQIRIRYAKADEKIQLLDQSEISLNSSDLVIADAAGAQALAGVMGGLHSAVDSETTDIILESAYFSAPQIASQRARHQLQSESSHRFERGVDPHLSEIALARAVDLISSIAGGAIESVLSAKSEEHFPKKRQIHLSLHALNQLAGTQFSIEEVKSTLKSLRFICEIASSENDADIIFNVIVPSDRWDIQIPEDLMEEVIRIFGFDRIPLQHLKDELSLPIPSKLDAPDFSHVSNLLTHLGYQEIISYSFVDPDLQGKINSIYPIKTLTNPISKELSQMRTQLWSGLLKTATHHFNYGEFNLRLFELAICFRETETLCLGGLVSGNDLPEQWGAPKKQSHFFSVKGDLENILISLGIDADVQFIPKKHLALHDGKSARLMMGDISIGWLGEIHPMLAHELDISVPVILFEVDLSAVLQAKAQITRAPIQLAPKLPSVRRDLALLVPDQLAFSVVVNTIQQLNISELENIFLFDRYQGAGVQTNYVSLAVGLIFRHAARTLTEEEIQILIENIIEALKLQGISLRS